ncbi:hypothetical protein BV20DRAFT_96373 [Pilatotrama ljubarskyi]|nr:hypothetical protein BV20DRAFT_96373 [Pilatotrama ljubarskyi]
MSTTTSISGRYGHSGGLAATCCLQMHAEAMGNEEVSWIPGGFPARLRRGIAQLLARCSVLGSLPSANVRFSTSELAPTLPPRTSCSPVSVYLHCSQSLGP